VNWVTDGNRLARPLLTQAAVSDAATVRTSYSLIRADQYLGGATRLIGTHSALRMSSTGSIRSRARAWGRNRPQARGLQAAVYDLHWL